MEQESEIRGGATGGRSIDQGNEGVRKSTMKRKANGAVEPQAVGVEAWGPTQGVVASVMVETGEVSVPLQGAEDGHVGDIQGVPELLQGGNGPALEVVEDSSLLWRENGTCYSM